MIIFDLDGTLADIAWRHPMVENTARGGANWPKFEASCVQDQPIWPVVTIFNALYREGRALEIWSGRSETVRPQTVSWLTQFVFYPIGESIWNSPEHPKFVPLRMRPVKNNTPDAELKEQWLMEQLSAGKTVNFVIDDRQRLVDMWRRNGIFCLQTAEGDY